MYTVVIMIIMQSEQKYRAREYKEITKVDVIDGNLVMWRKDRQIPVAIVAKGCWESVDIV